MLPVQVRVLCLCKTAGARSPCLSQQLVPGLTSSWEAAMMQDKRMTKSMSLGQFLLPRHTSQPWDSSCHFGGTRVH